MSEEKPGAAPPVITAQTPVDTVLDLPGAMTYCIRNGISPFSCAGDYPGSIGELLRRKNAPDPDGFIAGLNALAAGGGGKT
jgi:hypothetical protein